jgi:hypothetical protein
MLDLFFMITNMFGGEKLELFIQHFKVWHFYGITTQRNNIKKNDIQPYDTHHNDIHHKSK